MFAPDLRIWWEMFAAFEKCSRPTFAPEEKCLRPMRNVHAQPLHLKRNVCGLWKIFAPNFAPEEKCLQPMKNVRAKLCAWREMFTAYEKYLRQTLCLKRNVCGPWKIFAPNFAPEEKCLRPMKNGAKERRGKKLKIKIKGKQWNNHKFQRKWKLKMEQKSSVDINQR